MKTLTLIALLICSQYAFGECIGTALQKVLSRQAVFASNPSFPSFKYIRVGYTQSDVQAPLFLEEFALGKVTPADKVHTNINFGIKEVLSPDWQVAK